MPLQAGARLGPYEILALIGAGGMGEVYRARDTRLERTVAIKVLPAQLADDPQFRDRFEREAKAIAALTHPHICTLYDVGHQDAVEYLVMEFLEGETLESRLKKGGLPLDQALKTAIEIASALDKAHRAGIVHRDLKPGNIMLTKTGAKLLDFGLAKSSPVVAAAGLSMLPTTPPNLTVQGTILGTFQYMAPEQLEGQEADARTDIFAFGAVVYEMLTGKKAFEGKSQASLIAAILQHEPPSLMITQPLTPPLLDRVIKKCLAKEPQGRWQTAHDLLDELSWIADTKSQAGIPASNLAGRGRSERLAWLGAVVTLSLVVAGLSIRGLRPAPMPAEMRLDISTPPGGDPVSLAISPDGRRIVFVGSDPVRLWLRTLDAPTARPLVGTESALYPFWSPDGRSVGFFADGKLKRIDIEGGVVQILAPAPNGRGGSWNQEGTILYAPVASGPLLRISATGGQPVEVTRLVGQQTDHRSPQFLPDGRHFLYYARGGPDSRGIYVGQIDSMETRRLLDADAGPLFIPSGYLLFVRQAALFAQSFDPVRLTLSDRAFQVADQVLVNTISMAALSTSAAAGGPIAYRAGTTAPRQFEWFDRSGRALRSVGDETVGSSGPSLSRDGRTVVFERTVGANLDIWLLDTERGALTPVTSDPIIDFAPIWSSDGTRIVFQSARDGKVDLYEKTVAGSEPPTLLLTTPQQKFPSDMSADGRFLLYWSQDAQTARDIWAMPLDGGRTPFPVVKTTFDELDAQFSPDGRWISYESNASGRFEIYAQPFPGPGTPVPISTNGGAQARWRRDGSELFYVALDGRLMAVSIRLTLNRQTLEAGVPVPLFATRIGGALGPVGVPQYVAAPDGQRFLMNTVKDQPTLPITVVLNWKGRP